MKTKTLILTLLTLHLTRSQILYITGADGADGKDVYTIHGPAIAGDGGHGDGISVRSGPRKIMLLRPETCSSCDFSHHLKPDFFTFADDHERLVNQIDDSVNEIHDKVDSFFNQQQEKIEKLIEPIYKRPKGRSCACCPGTGNIWIKTGLGGKGGKAYSKHGVAVDGRDGGHGVSVVNVMGFSPCCCARTCGTTCGGRRQCGAGCGCSFGH